MEVTLPKSDGWSAMPLLDTNWGRVGAVAKRVYVWNGNDARATDPVPIRQADEMAGNIILAEAEMALFKTAADWHFRGLGIGGANTPGALSAAEIRIGGAIRLTYARPVAPLPVDPQNLFGFEPRGSRKIDANLPVPPRPIPFDFAKYGPPMFRGTRRSDGYLPANDVTALPASMQIEVQTHQGTSTATPLSKSLTLPNVILSGWLHESGPDTPAYWCAHAHLPMVPDTLILSLTGAEVLWRATFPLTALPLADLRRLSIEEAA